MTKKLKFYHLSYTSDDAPTALLEFTPNADFIYGASNTGKSFILKSLNFLLGGSVKELPGIDEREPYNRALLGIDIPGYGPMTLVRATRGGDFELFEGLHKERPNIPVYKTLGATHKQGDPNTLSQLLLNALNFNSKRIAKNQSGQKQNLSFRNLVRYCLVNETSIQAEYSPITGDRPDPVLDQSIFRLLLSGSDDAALPERLTAPQFKVSKEAKMQTVEDLLQEIEIKISEAEEAVVSQPDLAQIEADIATVHQFIDNAQLDIRSLISQKLDIFKTIEELDLRHNDIDLHLTRFAKLNEVYISDQERLESIEEVGFLLNVGGDLPCPLCKSTPEHHDTNHGSENIDAVRQAALVEIEKIKVLQSDLHKTTEDLNAEKLVIKKELVNQNETVDLLEEKIRKNTSFLREKERSLAELLDQLNRLTSVDMLKEQRQMLLEKKAQYSNEKRTRESGIDLSPPNQSINKFCKIVTDLLDEWHFPGYNEVSFAPETYDIRIHGKLRTDNGKGVRALTHAAFKIALMIYCDENDLPHPGFIMLDSPLLTYRDPIKSPKHGELSDDERKLSNSSVKYFFIEHLSKLKENNQIIILDNTDPPENINKFATPQLFSGQATVPNQRVGFFPI